MGLQQIPEHELLKHRLAMRRRAGHDLSNDLSIPRDAVTQKIAFLGISGSGKTYGAGKFVEEIVGMNSQVVVIDTIGNWWGLRVSAAGGDGIQIPIMGGERGDVPVESDHGSLVAELVARDRASVVVDISNFTEGEIRRFVIDFAKTLLVEKRKAPSPVMIVWEECQDIVPQQVFGEDAKMVGAMKRLVKKGRNFGVGTTLISQRCAAVNKDVLDQCETMFVFRTVSKLDRKAIEGWVTDKAPSALPIELSKLENGECMVYSPMWLKVHKQIKINPKWTFDASATPQFDDKGTMLVQGPRDLSAANLTAFKAKMGEVIAKAKANNPEELKAKIAELERLNKTLSYNAARLGGTGAADNGALLQAERKIGELQSTIAGLARDVAIRTEQLARMSKRVAGFNNAIDKAIATFTEISERDRSREVADANAKVIPVRDPSRDLVKEYQDYPRSISQVVKREKRETLAKATAESHAEFDPHLPHVWRPIRSCAASTGTPMSRPARAFLTALAQHGALSKAQLLVHTGYAAAGPISKAFSELGKALWVTIDDRVLTITDRGKSALGEWTPLPVGSELREYLLKGTKLGTAEKRLLGAACVAWPAQLKKRDLLQHAGYAAAGPVSKAIARLIAMGYMTSPKQTIVRAADLLFDGQGDAHVI